jgi:hypothetical protein
MDDTYTCEKCGNSLLKSNKLLHDLHCQSNTNNNNIINYFSDKDKNNMINDLIDINEMDEFACPICGHIMQTKDKLDHMLCHQLEGENKENEIEVNNSNNLNFNFNSDLLEDNNNGINISNNIHINIFNDNGHNKKRIHHNFRINFDDKNNYDDENEDFEDDVEEQEELNSVNEELDDDELDDEVDNGIEDNIIETFPVSKIKDISKLTDDKKKCCICLENFKINDETINLPCIHIFHSGCIKKWMKRKDICPICKNKIIDEDELN